MPAMYKPKIGNFGRLIPSRFRAMLEFREEQLNMPISIFGCALMKDKQLVWE